MSSKCHSFCLISRDLPIYFTFQMSCSLFCHLGLSFVIICQIFTSQKWRCIEHSNFRPPRRDPFPKRASLKPLIWEMDGTSAWNRSPHLYYKASLRLQAALWVVQQSQKGSEPGCLQSRWGVLTPRFLFLSLGWVPEDSEQLPFVCPSATQKLPRPLGFL